MASFSSILKQTATDSLVVFSFKILAVPIAYLIPLMVARLYGAQLLGTYSIVANLLLTIAVFCRLGLDQGILRFVAELQAKGKAGDAQRLLWPALFLATSLSGVLTLVIFFLGDWLAHRFHAPQLPTMLTFAAFALPVIVAAFMFRETIRALGGVRWVIFQYSILTPLLMLVLATLPAFLVPQVILPARTLGLALLLSNVLGLVFLGVKLRVDLKCQTYARENSFRELMRYSWPLFLSSIIMLSMSSWDNLILGLFNTPEKVAYYEAAIKTASLVVFPLVAINAVVPPLFAKFYHWQDHAGLESLARATAGWTFSLALPLSLVGLLMAADLLQFFGMEFVEAKWALRLVVLGQLFNVACGSVGYILAMTGHQWSYTLIQAGSTAVGIPLMIFTSWKYGLTGLAGVRALWLVAINLLMSWAVWRHLGIKAFAGKVQAILVGGIIGVALFYIAEPYLGVIGGLVVFSLGYLAVVAKLMREEFARLLRQPQFEEIK